MTDYAKTKRGFSLLEMTVVLGIAGVMTVIALWNLPQMKGGLSIDVVAQELAIYVRGGQVYSRATKVTSEGLADQARLRENKFHSFGLHFEKGKNSFFLWSDKNDSAFDTEGADGPGYAFDSADAVEETYYLPDGYLIDGLYSDGSCSGGEWKEYDYAQSDVLFRRPEPEAYFACAPAAPCGDVCRSGSTFFIKILSPNKEQWRFVRVSSNGQIVVQKELPQ